MKYLLLLASLPCFSFSSDKSDQLPTVNHDNVTNNITITNTSPAPSPRRVLRPSKINEAGPRHPAVDAAHQELARRREEDDFITCCCFFKMKKIPLR